MAKSITQIHTAQPSPEEQQARQLAELTQSVAQHGEALQQTLKLVQELHNSGALQMLQALLQAKEQVAEIAVHQMSKPAVTRTVNHAREAVGALGELDPAVTKQVVSGVVSGMERARESLERNEQVGMLDLWKAMRDPHVNKAVTALIGFLKGMGEKL